MKRKRNTRILWVLSDSFGCRAQRLTVFCCILGGGWPQSIRRDKLHPWGSCQCQWWSWRPPPWWPPPWWAPPGARLWGGWGGGQAVVQPFRLRLPFFTRYEKTHNLSSEWAVDSSINSNWGYHGITYSSTANSAQYKYTNTYVLQFFPNDELW